MPSKNLRFYINYYKNSMVLRKYKKPARKMYKKRITRRRRTNTLSLRSGSIISQQYITRLKYSESFSLTYVSGIPNEYQFRLNSIFDPNYTGAGHQPLGHDQLATIYGRYRVFGCSYKLTIVPNNSTVEAITVVPTNSVTTFSTYDDAVEQRASKSLTTHVQDTCYLRGYISLPSVTGVTKTQYKTDDRFQALFNTSPTEVIQLHIAGLSSSSTTKNYRIDMLFHVELFDPIQLTQS